ncbi:MAG: DUF1684 domain-containing protein [Bacteroidota bacterium]
MKKFIIAFLLLPTFLLAQESDLTYAESIAQHREEYMADFLKDERAPLKEDDLQHLRFFDAAEKYRVRCTFELTPDEKPFELPTYSGITKPYRKYGVLTFQLDGQEHSLAVYQSLKHIRHPVYKNYLFLPYRDLTNDESTYGGGRYIDVLISEVEAETVFLDFNKSYHPWCHYSDGYNCPIPPTENHLEVAILAGEKMYVGEKKHREKK